MSQFLKRDNRLTITVGMNSKIAAPSKDLTSYEPGSTDELGA